MSTPAPLSTKLAWLLAASAMAGLLWWHAAVVAPFLVSLVLAYALHPAVDCLQRWRWPRALAVSACLCLLVLTVLILLVLVVPIVSQLVPMLRDQLPDLLMRLWRELAPRFDQWGLPVPTTIDDLKQQLSELLQNHMGQWSSAVWTSLLVGGGGLLSLAGWVVLLPMLTFYWLLDWAVITARIRALLPARWRTSAHDFMAECDELMGQYLRGQVMVMLILAAYYSVGLALFGFRLALPIGVFTGLAVCIPYLGYGLGLLLALLAGLLQFAAVPDGWGHALLAVAVVYGLGQVIESFFLTPRLVGERIGLHPLGVILALMLFGQWLGFIGVVVALPMAAFGVLLGRRLLRTYQRSGFFLGS